MEYDNTCSVFKDSYSDVSQQLLSFMAIKIEINCQLIFKYASGHFDMNKCSIKVYFYYSIQIENFTLFGLFNHPNSNKHPLITFSSQPTVNNQIALCVNRNLVILQPTLPPSQNPLSW